MMSQSPVPGQIDVARVEAIINDQVCAGDSSWRAAITKAEALALVAEIRRLRAASAVDGGPPLCSLVRRWQVAHTESVAAYRAWDDACNEPGKPRALDARMRLQEAGDAVVAIEKELAGFAVDGGPAATPEGPWWFSEDISPDSLNPGRFWVQMADSGVRTGFYLDTEARAQAVCDALNRLSASSSDTPPDGERTMKCDTGWCDNEATVECLKSFSVRGPVHLLRVCQHCAETIGTTWNSPVPRLPHTETEK